MNSLNYSYLKRLYPILITCVVTILVIFSFKTTLADNIALEVQTQLNERTDLFEQSITDLPDLRRELEDRRQNTINAMGDGKTSSPEGLSSITKKSKSELELESGRLGAINEHELNSRGRTEMIKNNTVNELYPDYTRPLNKQYMEDAKALAAGQNKLLANLLGKLKELGVDCKTIKGDARKEPEYFLKVKTTTYKDTVYNQTFCEELRNTYNCGDTLTVKCNVKGMEWGEWQDKKIIVPGDELVDYQNDLMTSNYVAKETFEYKLFIAPRKAFFIAPAYTPDPGLIDRMKIYLATKHEGATKENIDTSMKAEWGGGIYSIQGRMYGGSPCGHKAYAHRSYHIYYRYRDGKPACLSWSENVSEKCSLK